MLYIIDMSTYVFTNDRGTFHPTPTFEVPRCVLEAPKALEVPKCKLEVPKVLEAPRCVLKAPQLHI
jgi:hypothetical protein